jgi:tellurite resistance-related uncharacterized protein
MKTLPDDVHAYRRTSVFTQDTAPKGFFKDHTTRDNVWALLHIVEGQLEYTIDGTETHILEPGVVGVIEPRVRHHIRALGEVSFFIEFYKKEGQSEDLFSEF